MSSDSETSMVPETPPGYSWTPEWLEAIRSRPNRRRGVLVVAALVGLGLAWFHWLGLVLAGALVGLGSRTLPRSVAAGLLVGVLALLLHVLASPVMGLSSFLRLTPLSYVAVATALVAPVWGSLLRAVV